MTRRIARIVPGLVVALGGLVALGGASPQEQAKVEKAETKVEPGSRGHGKMVFVLTTGLEDLQSVNMAIRHAGMAMKSGYLDDSVLLVYGRSVQAFSKDITAKPPQVAAAIKEAKEAGARIILCGEALKRFDIPREKLEPGVDEVVPNSIVTLAELVSKGYQIIKY
ncbi:DsrE family protein [Planctomyces sp. SH-PL62]|uniref:DsrE family protein n=1 Tax=Planctomyces sp. SH-PL62 TaxID=1636152 RepID=UPI0018D2A107|nr:DsrE family protein [Planctomyces sp. SH-PL62]